MYNMSTEYILDLIVNNRIREESERSRFVDLFVSLSSADKELLYQELVSNHIGLLFVLVYKYESIFNLFINFLINDKDRFSNDQLIDLLKLIFRFNIFTKKTIFFAEQIIATKSLSAPEIKYILLIVYRHRKIMPNYYLELIKSFIKTLPTIGLELPHPIFKFFSLYTSSLSTSLKVTLYSFNVKNTSLLYKNDILISKNNISVFSDFIITELKQLVDILVKVDVEIRHDNYLFSFTYTDEIFKSILSQMVECLDNAISSSRMLNKADFAKMLMPHILEVTT